jgi:AcrR family transcriptional regulator
VALYEDDEVGDQLGSPARETPTVSKPASPKPRGRSKAEQREQSREQILDGAEYLFSLRGLYGVTLKDVAQQVGVHTSLLHYYFEDKRGIFDAVVARRAPQSAERRMQAMDDYERAAGDNVTVEGALHAFLDTELDAFLNGGPHMRNYGAMGAHFANTPEGGEVLNTHFDRVVLRLIHLLQKAMPGAAEEDIFWGYHFVSAALMMTLGRTGRIDRLTDGLCRSDDYDAVSQRIAPFMAAGFIAICKSRAAERAALVAAAKPPT